MPEYIIVLVLSSLLGGASFFLRRIDLVDNKVDKLELKVAETYVTKDTLFRMFDRLEVNLSRIEEKIDAHVLEDPYKLQKLKEKYYD